MIDDSPLSFSPLGDAALVVETPHSAALQRQLLKSPPAGVLDVVAGLGQVTILFDPSRTNWEVLAEMIGWQWRALEEVKETAGALLELSVSFGGPDLPWCAERAELSEEEFIEQLCAVELRVAFLGFSAGFAFLQGLPPKLQMPRLAEPRLRVPAGSVGLGGPWAGVYPQASPGGWRLIGHSDLRFFDPRREPPTLWQAGDRVRLIRR